MSSRPACREVKACGVVFVRLVNLPAHLWSQGERADESHFPFPSMQTYLLIEDARQGPFTPEEIAAKLQSGECTPETLAWKEGMEEWQPLHDVLPKAETAQAPSMSVPPPLPEVPAANPATVAGGSNAFLDFFRAYKGMFQRIKNSPLPQPVQWYDRYPVVFPAAFLAFFFYGLGLIPLWLTSRLSRGDKGRLSVIATWPLCLAMLPAFVLLLVLLLLILPLAALVTMWVKQWFTPAVRVIVTAIMGLGFLCFIALLAIAAAKDSGSSREPRFSTGKPYDGMSTEERNAMEAAMEGEVVKIASDVFGGRNYVLGAEAAMYSKEAGGRFPLIVYITRDYLRDFTTLRSSQEKEAFIFTDMKSFFSQVKASSKFAGVKNVFLTYGADEFYDVYHNMGQSVPAGVLEFMLPMPTIKGTDWESLSNDDVARRFKLYGHYKVYKD